jgi:hypothetical protein
LLTEGIEPNPGPSLEDLKNELRQRLSDSDLVKKLVEVIDAYAAKKCDKSPNDQFILFSLDCTTTVTESPLLVGNEQKTVEILHELLYMIQSSHGFSPLSHNLDTSTLSFDNLVKYLQREGFELKKNPVDRANRGRLLENGPNFPLLGRTKALLSTYQLFYDRYSKKDLGAINAIMGPPGCGKSYFLDTLAALCPDDLNIFKKSDQDIDDRPAFVQHLSTAISICITYNYHSHLSDYELKWPPKQTVVARIIWR